MNSLPTEIQRMINILAFDTDSFKKVLNELNILHWQRRQYKLCENEQCGHRPYNYKVNECPCYRTIQQIIKIGKIRRICKDCKLIIYCRDIRYKFCNCRNKYYYSRDYYEIKDKLELLGLNSSD